MRISTDKPVIILHNLRSVQNVGAIIRTAACFGDFLVYCTGHTPYPKQANDTRLPHLAKKQTEAIAKTSLGAEAMVAVRPAELSGLVTKLKKSGYEIVACEQTDASIPLADWMPPPKTALMFGNEPEGIDDVALALTDRCIEIPMTGMKESLNVSAAAAIVLYDMTSKLIHNTH